MIRPDPRPHGLPTRPVLFALQHVVLPNAAFANHPALLAELAAKRPGYPLAGVWLLAEAYCAETWGVDAHRDDSSDLGLTDHLVEFAAEEAFRHRTVVHRTKRHGHTLTVFEMPAPEHTGECYAVAVLHRDGVALAAHVPAAGTRVFGLQASHKDDRGHLRERHPDGTRTKHGDIPADTGAFIDWVFGQVPAEPSKAEVAATPRPAGVFGRLFASRT